MHSVMIEETFLIKTISTDLFKVGWLVGWLFKVYQPFAGHLTPNYQLL